METLYNIPDKENERIEFKKEWTETAKKTLIAFANTFGGTIYFGVMDDGQPTGIENTDAISRSIFTFARHGVDPDMSRLINTRTFKIDDKTILAVTVSPGDDRPYAFTGKNWTAGGVFIRMGSSSIQASRSEILGMAIEAKPWEERISPKQDLTFSAAESICRECSVPFSSAHYSAYGFIDHNKRFTNLALLISDQNNQGLNINDFTGFGGRYESSTQISGSILLQRVEALKVLNSRNTLSIEKTTQPNERVDAHPWPAIALREALTNCLVHRDFDIQQNSPTSVNFFKDRVIFQTMSNLPFEITMEDLFQDGFSFCRNNRLAEFFFRLRWMEKVGSGFTEIFASYSGIIQKPTCECSGRVFKIILPKVEFLRNLDEKIISLLRMHGELTRKEIENATQSSRASVNKTLLTLVKQQLVVREGLSRATKYRLRIGA